MRRPTSLLSRLAVAAVVSGLAAILMVAVGPGFGAKPDDLGPNENAAEQAQDNAADRSASESDADVSASEDASSNASENASDNASSNAGGQAADDDTDDTDSAEAAADNGNKPDGPPGQTQTDLVGGGAGAGANSDSAPGHTKVNEDTSQTGLPRGQEEDDCTNKHHGADNDFSGNGANQHGVYDNTCDGRASENGSGGGNATGRPCMGCVGNADDKNPRGQSPNHLGGKDHNAGYECDRNKGVGQGNPAHTDCRPTDILTICHSSNSGATWRVVTDTRDDIEEILEDFGPTYAFVVAAGTDPDECEKDDDDPDCLGHVPPHDNHGPDHPGCQPKEKVWICHATGSATNPYVVIRVSPNAWDDDDGHGHAGHSRDFEVPAGTDKAECDEEEEDEDCLGHSPPHDNHEPGDAACEDDDEDELSICHVEGNEGTIYRNLDEDDAEEDHLDPHPADFIVDDDADEEDCGDEEPSVVVKVCPAASDRPMGVIPEGETAAWCYDEVQGEVIERPANPKAPNAPQPDVQGKLVPRARGGLLPFTGASLLAFIVLALQLIAAGSLIMRGRRA